MNAPADSAWSLPENPTLGDLCMLLERGLRLGLHTVLPGRVISFSPATPPPKPKPATVEVQPSLSVVWWALGGQEVPEPRKPVPAAVLCHWQSGGFRKTAKPRAGDTGLLLICERSIEDWRTSGGEPEVPRFIHTHGLQDAFFLPMGRPGPNGLTVPDGLSISTDTGTTPEPGEIAMDEAGNVTVEGPSIKLGRTAAAPTGQLALASALHEYLLAMIGGAAVGVMDGGAAFKGALVAYMGLHPFTDFATTKTVAQ